VSGQSASITVTNALTEVARVAALVDAFAAAHAVPESALNDMQVAVDEAVSNIVRHAFPDGGMHLIRVDLSVAAGRLFARLEDDGIAFDPTSAPASPPEGSLDKRPAGGLGLLFMRTLLDSMVYRREDRRNVLELAKAFEPKTIPANLAGASIAREVLGDVVVLVPSGRIVSDPARALEQEMRALADSGVPGVVLDLSHVNYLTSAAFRAMLAGTRVIEAHGGRVALCGIDASLGRLFSAGGFDGLFRTFASREDALSGVVSE
jgi:serine/threonine-protein kinase RsbW